MKDHTDLPLESSDDWGNVLSLGETRFFRATEFEGAPVPERDWVVDGLIPAKTVTILNGDGGTGKSLIALQLAAAAALGTAWMGRVVDSGPVLFLSAEDDREELHRRIDGVRQSEGVEWSELSNLLLSSLAGEDAILAAFDRNSGLLRPTVLYAEISDWIARKKPRLVVLDTAADLYGGNENDRAQVRHFIGMLRGLAIKHDTAVLLLAHPSLSGMSSGSGSSGSTAWSNSVRSRLYLSRVINDGYEGDANARILQTKKSNYGPTGEQINLRWADGVFEPVIDALGPLERMAATARAERVFLRLLGEITEQGRYVSAQPGPTYAPTVFEKNPSAEGVSKRAFCAAMEKLFSAQKIRVAHHGKGTKQRSHIEVIEQ